MCFFITLHATHTPHVSVCVSSNSTPVCVCVILHLLVMFRPSDETDSPTYSLPPVVERTSGSLPGSISVVYRDKVMTAL